jgi:DNA gyrase/topoisomerase IV subunit A
MKKRSKALHIHESDKVGMRLVIDSNVEKFEVVLNNLYKQTPLQDARHHYGLD